MFNFTLHVCGKFSHMVNIDVLADVGAPPLDTQLIPKPSLPQVFDCLLKVTSKNWRWEWPAYEAS